MRKLAIDGRRCTFEVHGKDAESMANALRRALITDVSNYAPHKVRIRKNTSCQTDEYIAHRIGLIPFRATNDDEADAAALSMHVVGRDAMASDLQGTAFRAPVDVPILKLIDDQTLDLDVTFERGTGSVHARFSHIGPVEYRSRADGVMELAFEMITDEDPLDYLERAVISLESRVQASLVHVEG